ncbi:uncharacterized protein UV8b_00857 [Ustilaginoidea virens]|nr:uncharacterized protein UV8b_00857 [Ustilaginoidea virens]QUC16616.1 hypothetical protein UV8b_00857 [Ustilaginoidea virens]
MKALLLTATAFASLASGIAILPPSPYKVPHAPDPATMWRVSLYQAAASSLVEQAARDTFTAQIYKIWRVPMNDPCGLKCYTPSAELLVHECAARLAPYVQAHEEKTASDAVEMLKTLSRATEPPVPADKLTDFINSVMDQLATLGFRNGVDAGLV